MPGSGEMVSRVASLSDSAARLAGLAGMALAILALLMVCGISIAEILLRWLFAKSTHLREAGVGYAIAMVTFGPLAYAVSQGESIRVTLISDRLPDRARWWLELAVYAAGILLTAFLLQYFWTDFSRSLARGTTSGGFIPVPLWVPALIILTGVVLLLVALVADCIALMADPGRVRRGDPQHSIQEL